MKPPSSSDDEADREKYSNLFFTAMDHHHLLTSRFACQKYHFIIFRSSKIIRSKGQQNFNVDIWNFFFDWNSLRFLKCASKSNHFEGQFGSKEASVRDLWRHRFNHFRRLISSAADVINKFWSNVARLCWNKALSLAVSRQKTIFSQSESVISTPFYNFLWHLLQAQSYKDIFSVKLHYTGSYGFWFVAPNFQPIRML